MTQPSLRRLPAADIPDRLYELNAYAFRPSPPLYDRDEWDRHLKTRKEILAFGMFEEEKPVSVVAATPMIQTVRKKQFSMGGIWGVATHPQARRKGYARQLLQALLASLKEEGHAFSCLYPFRESFYEKLGYVTFPQPTLARFEPAALAPLLKTDLAGQVTMFKLREVYDQYISYLNTYQQTVPGMALEKYPHPPVPGEDKYWLALATHKETIAGIMLYSLRGEEVTQFKLQARRFYYTNSTGKYLLLNWIARHIDQANQAELWLPPSERPETWLADMNVERKQLWIPPMGRVLDVAGLNGLLAGPGSVSVQIRDTFCPWNEGIWRLETGSGKLQVSPAQEPDFQLSIQALSALVYGTHEIDDFPVRDWGDPNPAQRETLKIMFPRKLPYLHLFF